MLLSVYYFHSIKVFSFIVGLQHIFVHPVVLENLDDSDKKDKLFFFLGFICNQKKQME